MMKHRAFGRRWAIGYFVMVSVSCVPSFGQLSEQTRNTSDISTSQTWQVPISQNFAPHFEEANGRKVLYVDGRPFTVLAVEIPWWHLIYGRYKETETAYDSLYPAAEKIGLNALKVPIKWSMVEPEKGVYDFSYIDHAKRMAEKH